MQKIIVRYFWVIILGILLSIFAWGAHNMYFHQDDLDWFILANRPFGEMMRAPIGDHINYLWRVLLALEWREFGFVYWPYLLVSLTMHAGVITLLYQLAKETSGQKVLGMIAALLFAINTNWTETVLWISGQTISITVLFVLLAMMQVWRKRGEIGSIALACLTSALALGLPLATIIVHKKQRLKVVILLSLVAIIYLSRGGDGTNIALSALWIAQVGAVWVLIPINSVVGRLLIPFDRLELLRIGFVLSVLVYGLWRWRRMLGKVWSDVWSRFLLLQMAFYYLIVAVGRAQYGVGIMRAERYSYLGLALTLLLLARLLRGIRLGRWIWVVSLIVVVQVASFYHRAKAYIARPQQLRALVESIRAHPESVEPGVYLPHYVLGDERLRYSDLLPLVED